MKFINLESSYRQKRFEQFITNLNVGPKDKILDLGGYEHTWENYIYKDNITIVNIELPKNKSKNFKWLRVDACNLSFIKDKSYDIVFSNSVIEHVGDFSKQKQMAEEIIRVGKKYWIQTPNKYFPIEIHSLFPYFNFLPNKTKYIVAKLWPFSFAKKLNLDAIEEMENIWSIDYKLMQKYFPNAKIIREKFWGLTKSLIAYKNE